MQHKNYNYPFQFARKNVLSFFHRLLQVGIQSQQSLQLNLFTLSFALFEPFYGNAVCVLIHTRYHRSVYATCEQKIIHFVY